MGLCQSQQDLRMLADYLREMFATFFFTVIVGMTSDNPRGIEIPALAIGFGCAVLAESERAHMNPVISLAIALCDPCFGWTALFLRVLAQLVGCIFGGLTAVDGLRDVRLEFSVSFFSGVDRAVALELFFSFVMVLVVLRTRRYPSGSFAYGLCYTVAILCGNRIFSGNALINPAAAVGIMFGSSAYDPSTTESYLWIFLVAPIIGSLLAAMFFQFTEFLFDDDDDYESYTSYTEDRVVEGTEVVRTEDYSRLANQRPVQQPAGSGYQAPVARNQGETRRPVEEVSPAVSRGYISPVNPQDIVRPATRGGYTPSHSVVKSASTNGNNYLKPVTRSAQRGYTTPSGRQETRRQTGERSPSGPANGSTPSTVRYRETHNDI